MTTIADKLVAVRQLAEVLSGKYQNWDNVKWARGIASEILAELPRPEEIDDHIAKEVQHAHACKLEMQQQRDELKKDVAKLIVLLQEGSGLVMESTISDATLQVQLANAQSALKQAVVYTQCDRDCVSEIGGTPCSCGRVDLDQRIGVLLKP